MRELKYRAYIKKSNKLCPVVSIGFDLKWVTVSMGGLFRTFKFSKVVLIQYTGLKDKNGKEEYFGDICKYKDQAGREQIGVIKDHGYFSGYIEAIGGDEEGNQDGELHPDEITEVIGNIHENPELLNES